ncbi:MAG TPA: BolA family transcriptional regulator [Kofleriaceae bacterium]|jgi:stress-induced morphogen|nr:BolA family transcriptional regulator [Kofleriaceae bacterium]
MQRELIIERIRAVLPDARVELRDLTGTADHWEATIVSAAFAGKSPVERHRMVYAALADELRGPIHALTLVLRTPDM